MKISTKGRYGVRASLELAMRFGEGPVMVRDIAASQNISERYLEQILNTLRTADVVKSTRGAHGGYELASKPADIILGDIVRALEGPLDVVECTRLDCESKNSCAAATVWSDIRDALEGVLDSLTLADLAERQRSMTERGREYTI